MGINHRAVVCLFDTYDDEGEVVLEGEDLCQPLWEKRTPNFTSGYFSPPEYSNDDFDPDGDAGLGYEGFF